MKKSPVCSDTATAAIFIRPFVNIINKLRVNLLPLKNDDCKTKKAGKNPLPAFSLYAYPGGESAPISRWEEGAIRPVPESFEGLGAACLKKALEGPVPVVLLDEIGRFEKDCPAFLGRVEELLGSEKMVVAVLKQEPLPYLDRWRALPGALLLDLDRISPPQAREVLEQELPPLHWGLTLRLYGQEKSFGPGPLRLGTA